MCNYSRSVLSQELLNYIVVGLVLIINNQFNFIVSRKALHNNSDNEIENINVGLRVDNC